MAQNTANRSKWKTVLNQQIKTGVPVHTIFHANDLAITSGAPSREKEVAAYTRAYNRASHEAHGFDVTTLLVENKTFSVSLPETYGELLDYEVDGEKLKPKNFKFSRRSSLSLAL